MAETAWTRLWRLSRGLAVTLVLTAFLAAAVPAPLAQAQGQASAPSEAQAVLYLVDSASRQLYLIDMVRALKSGNANGAVQWQGRLVDRAGQPLPGRPLGIAGVAGGRIYVSFDDGTLHVYNAEPDLVGPGGSKYIRGVRMPRVATRLSLVTAQTAQYLAYVATRDPSAAGKVFLLDPNTLAEKGMLPLADVARGPAGQTDPGGPGSRPGTGYSYAIAGLGGADGLQVLTADPQALMYLGLSGGADPALGGQIILENPLPLGPAAGPEGAALATAALPSGEVVHFVRKGNRIEVKVSENVFRARSFMTDWPDTGWAQKYGDRLALAWDPPGGRHYFSVACFAPDFRGTETVFFLRPNVALEETRTMIGRSLPFKTGPVPAVDPDVLTPQAARSLPVPVTEGAVPSFLYLEYEPNRPESIWRLPFPPRGCHRIDAGRDAASGAKYPVLGSPTSSPYFGTDPATGGRYIGNFWLRDLAGAYSFALPAEITAPQDIDVVLGGGFGTVSGAVRSADRNGNDIFLRDIPVTVSLDGVARTITAYTDEKGRYAVAIPALVSAVVRVRAELRDRNGVIAVRSPVGYGGGIISLQTQPLTLSGPQTTQDLVFLPGFAAVDSSMTAAQRAIWRDAAVFYHDLEQAARYARQTLKLEANHQLPVDVDLHSATAGVFYSPAASRINVTAAGGSSAHNAGDAPDNREYHEFGHHVHADSALGGENALPALGTGDTNHGGVDNGNSSDSLVEGFAEYFVLLVKGGARYRWAGTVTDLERNYHEIAPGKPDEEFNVAALLWDLTDPANEPEDRVQIPIPTLWQLLQEPQITTVRSLYEVLTQAYGRQHTDRADPLGDIDRLFVAHRFFHDANGNGAREPGEAIGYADYYQPAARPAGARRPARPPIPGTLLRPRLVDDAGRPLAAERYQVRVFFADPAANYDFETAPVAEQDLRIVVPTDSLRVAIAPMLAGYESDVLTLTPAAFWPAVAAAQTRGDDVFMAHTFRLTPNGIPTPTDLAAHRLPDGQVRLTWQVPAGVDEVALVRSPVAAPASPDQGTVVFRGSGAQFIDAELRDIAVHYTLFSLRGNATSRGVSVSIAPAAAATGAANDGDVGSGRTVVLVIDETAAHSDGRPVTLEVAPAIVGGRTLVPLRFVAEALGAEVGYDPDTRGITIQLGGRRVELWLDQTRARIDGAGTQLDVPPLVRSGRSLVPIRIVAEALGARVEWDPDARSVTIRR